MATKFAWGRRRGVVICSIEIGEFSSEAPEDSGVYLKGGAVIKFPKFGLIHYETAEPDLVLIAGDAKGTNL